MKAVILTLGLLGIWPFSSGTEYHISGSRVVPAATAKVKVEQDKQNRNTKIDLKVEHLAKPSSLTPPANVYVVWVQPRGGAPEKEGALGVDNDLKGELKAVTVQKDFDLLVTAENSEAATYPSSVQIFQTHVNAT